MLVMMSNMSVPICNRLAHTMQANSGKTTFFSLGVLFFDALVRGELPYRGALNFITKNESHCGGQW